MVRLICVVGYPGSGKSVAADIAESEFDIPTAVMGNHVRERAESELEALLAAETQEEEINTWIQLEEPLREEMRDDDGKLDLSRSNIIGSWATVQRRLHGPEVVAEWTADYVKENLESETIIIDGVRSCAEYEVFESEFEEVDIVYVEAPFKTRLDRLRDRGRDGEDEFSKDDLKERDAREDEWGVEDIVECADVTIENTGTLEEYERALEETLFT